jgi:hypothetical protein
MDRRGEIEYGEEVPTGTYLDMAVNLRAVEPRKLLAVRC